MSDKARFMLLLIILALSIGLLMYVQTGIDANFTDSLR